jgi:hypothetical protein
MDHQMDARTEIRRSPIVRILGEERRIELEAHVWQRIQWLLEATTALAQSGRRRLFIMRLPLIKEQRLLHSFVAIVCPS